MKASFIPMIGIALCVIMNAHAQEPTEVAGKNFKVAFENDRVRVFDYSDQPRESVPMHSHGDSLVYAISAYTLEYTAPDGRKWTTSKEAGQVVWRDAETHATKNVGDTPARSLIIEFKATAKGQSLYHRLGGYDAIAAVTDDFIGRLLNDPQLKRFFTGLSNDSKNRVRQLVVDQLCAATGGPCVYIGRDMKTVHTGLGITEIDWDLSVNHLVASLDKFRVPEKEKEEFLALAATLKSDIVEPAP